MRRLLTALLVSSLLALAACAAPPSDNAMAAAPGSDDARPKAPQPAPARAPGPAPDSATIVCRCEDVEHGLVSEQVSAGRSANAVKLAMRCGMGACQGRNCEPTLLRMISAAGGRDDAGFTARFPARALCIADILSSG